MHVIFYEPVLSFHWMSRFEKFLLIFLAALSTAFLAEGSRSALTLSIWLLVVIYGVGAYGLFRSPSSTPAGWVRIGVGVSIALALAEVLNSLGLARGSYEQAAPALLGVVCLGLSTYLWLKRHVTQHVRAYRPMLIRSAIVFCFCAFFAYCPITVSFYRSVLLFLNADRPALTANLRMFDYAQRTEEAIEANNCAAAITYAQQAVANGKQWLGADSVTERHKVNGAYSNLYKAYRCQGDAAYEQARYEEALRSYQKGHRFLLAADIAKQAQVNHSTPWEVEEEAWSLNNLAHCNLKLHRLAQSDSLFVQAIVVYNKAQPTPDAGTARLISDLARSQAAGRQWATSTRLYQRANHLLAAKPTTQSQASIASNGLAVAINYLNQDSLPQALRQLRSLRFPPSQVAEQYEATMYQGVCYYRQNLYGRADSILRRSLRYYQAHPDKWPLEVACGLVLAKNCLARALYPEARTLATKAQALAMRKKGDRADVQARCVEVLAAVNLALGQYDIATQQLNTVLATYQREAGGNEVALSGVYAQLANLNVIAGNEETARANITAAIASVGDNGVFKYASQTELLNLAAYVDYVTGHYRTARLKYGQSLVINRRFGRVHSVATAGAWNGLGLIEMDLHNPIRADSLFAAAAALNEALLGEQNPATANVYLNYALLRVQQARLGEATALLQKARRSIEATLPSDHDMFGDLAAAQGDLAQRQGLPEARNHYKQALNIFNHKFGPTHWKTKSVLTKLAR